MLFVGRVTRAPRFICGLALLTLLAVAALGPAPTPTAAAEVTVTIESFTFKPATLTIPVGTTVRWTNNDSAPHTSTSEARLWASPRLQKGESFTFTFNEPGSFPYYCEVHPGMRAKILVTDGEPPAPRPGEQNFADPAFRALWAETDATAVGRTYVWGPRPFTVGLQEDYREAPGGKRLVQYFDKGRMELNQPGGAVTAGLLAVELITGLQQNGDATFVARQPARVPVAGDPDNLFPTYADLGRLRMAETDNTAAAAPITKLYRMDGSFGVYEPAASDPLAATAGFDAQTGHNLPRAFADFRAAPEFGGLPAIGFAITEPVWANVRVAGQTVPVLMQAFERRVLTYTPGNPNGFKVEYGNIGQSYYRWRYGAAAGGSGWETAEVSH